MRPIRRLLLVVLASLAAAPPAILPAAARAQAQLDPKYWIQGDWTVDQAVRVGTNLYLRGGFTILGPFTGGAVPLDPATGERVGAFPVVMGSDLSGVSVRRIIPDGAGGWFLGGQFTTVGGQPRANLAHVAADLTVTAWNPGTNGIVEDLELQGSTLYVAGWFTTLGGQTRNRLGAVDVTSGAVQAWNPNASGAVLDIQRVGSRFFAGGMFVAVGGQARTAIAEIDVATGATTAWNATMVGGSQVTSFALDGTTLYVGGSFPSIGGLTRNGIAALDTSSNTVTAFNPGSAVGLDEMRVHGGKLYLAGRTFSLGGQGRSGLAAVELPAGAVTSWAPFVPPQGVTAFAIVGNTAYVGGDFDYVRNDIADPTTIARDNLAAFDLTTGAATSWDPIAKNEPVRTLATDGTVLYAGGSFTTVNGVRRTALAALDDVTGEATSWISPLSNATCILRDGNTIYAAGYIGTDYAVYAIDGVTGALLPWSTPPGILGFASIDAMVSDATTIYAGGSFFGGARARLAAFDKATGALLPWDPNCGGDVRTLALNGGDVIVGGGFTTIGGQSRQRLAAVDKASGAVTAWDPAANSTVHDIAIANGTIYVAGEFTSIAGQARNRLAAFDAATSAITGWNPGANAKVTGLETNGGPVYISGSFTTCGTPTVGRNLMAALDPASGAATAWNPNVGPTNATMHAFQLDGTRLLTSGFQISIAGEIHAGFSVLADLGVAPVDAPVPAPATVAPRVFPNPLRSGGVVEFAARPGGPRSVSLFDVAGRRIRRLVGDAAGDGVDRWRLHAEELPSGVYFVRSDEAPGAATRVVVLH
ncbi:MAG: hypothetical protein R3B81_07715 [bacterium]